MGEARDCAGPHQRFEMWFNIHRWSLPRSVTDRRWRSRERWVPGHPFHRTSLLPSIMTFVPFFTHPFQWLLLCFIDNSMFSGQVQCSDLILYFSYPSLRVDIFPGEPWFQWETVFIKQGLSTGRAHCSWPMLLLDLFSEQIACVCCKSQGRSLQMSATALLFCVSPPFSYNENINIFTHSLLQ